MGDQHHQMTVYSAQTETVLSVLMQEGVCFSRRRYVAEKYGESAPIFLTAYDWFVKELKNRLPMPSGAEYPYWAFQQRYSVEASGLRHVLRLNIPMEEAVFFDLYDWNKILRLSYLGETPQEEEAFARALKLRGIRSTNELLLTNFYPDLKAEILGSWQRLFRHDRAIKEGCSPLTSVQAGLWQLKKEWLIP